MIFPGNRLRPSLTAYTKDVETSSTEVLIEETEEQHVPHWPLVLPFGQLICCINPKTVHLKGKRRAGHWVDSFDPAVFISYRNKLP